VTPLPSSDHSGDRPFLMASDGFDTLTDEARAKWETPCEIACTCVHDSGHPGPCHDHAGTVIPKRLPPRDYWDLP